MTPETLLAFAIYAFVTSITPGPNNMMLLASGVNHGLQRTVPHILGVSLGFAVMVLAIGIGLGEVFKAAPVLHTGLRWVGGAYLLWLSWQIAKSGPVEGETKTKPPLTFLQAALFQWVNPKCWVMATGAITTYLPAGGRVGDIAVIAVLYAVVNGPSVGSWAAFGMLLQKWLSEPRRLQVFNIVMALLLVASLHSLVTG